MAKDIKCRKWTLKSHFSGLPKREDLEIVEEQLPELKDGGRYTVQMGTLVSVTSMDDKIMWYMYARMQLYGTHLT